jgi:D-alanine transaminase
MSGLIAYVNGDFVPLEQAHVHVEDRGFQFADSVYEVIAYYGDFLDLTAHLRRLETSCTSIGMPLPCSLRELEERIRETRRRNPFRHASLYVQVTRGAAPRSLRIPEALTPTLVITCRELSFPPEQAPAFAAVTLRDLRWGRCDIKTTALIASVLGRQQAVRSGAEEAFWTDIDGHVLEGTATNVMAIIDGVLVTHPLNKHVLGGITRQMVLELARQSGIRVEERPWMLTEPGLNECMLTSTLYALAPVCVVDGQAIGNGWPGPRTRQLRQGMLERFRSLSA